MSQVNNPPSQDIQAEISDLHQELQMRDQLVEQLSGELFRLIKGNRDLTLNWEGSQPNLALARELQSLRSQFQAGERQISFYQEQVARRDAEIVQLRESNQELSDRNQRLEQVVQELPEVYRQRFSERLAQVKQKLEALQLENCQLQAELESISYSLALRNRRADQGELPNLPSLNPNSAQILPTVEDA